MRRPNSAASVTQCAPSQVGRFDDAEEYILDLHQRWRGQALAAGPHHQRRRTTPPLAVLSRRQLREEISIRVVAIENVV